MLKQLLPILLFVVASAAQATPIYTFSTDDLGASLLGSNGGANPIAGTVTSLTTSYSSSNQNFTWDYTVGPGSNGAVNDGFWLVVSDGFNPTSSGNGNQYAILYGDLDDHTVTAYVYNGQNNGDSYQNENAFIQSFTGSDAIITSSNPDGTTNVSVMIDATDINAYSTDSSWDGIVFGANLGLWFHPTANTDFSYNSTGGITNFFGPDTAVGYYDSSSSGSLTTVATVPEPTSIALLSIGAVACFGFRRRKAKVGATLS